jgi:hypothetical protein
MKSVSSITTQKTMVYLLLINACIKPDTHLNLNMLASWVRVSASDSFHVLMFTTAPGVIVGQQLILASSNAAAQW